MFNGQNTPSLSAEYVDYRLWRAGIKRHLHEKRVNGDERTYLRGLHSYSSLGALIYFLQKNIPNALFRMQSVWVDKHPQAHFGNNQNCELGDLLVIVRNRTISGSEEKSHSVGWLLQGKTARNQAIVQHPDKSTEREVDLYENHLSFTLEHYKKELGVFNLNNDTDIAAGAAKNKWEFLQFCLDQTAYSSSGWSSSPIQRIWPLGSPRTSNGQHSSFAMAILKIAQSSGNSPAMHGAVLERNSEWEKLCKTLLKFTADKIGKLPRGHWQHTYPNRGLGFYSNAEFNSPACPLTSPFPLDAKGEVVNTMFSNSFRSNAESSAFLEMVVETDLSKREMRTLLDSDRDPPDDKSSDREDGEGGMSTFIVDIFRQGS
jgi:hypothetical protein